ncbi:MAG: hypothetical protein H0T18_06605, partial [Chloroflexia bacterium]|nr:hypothetical protein [Chloroflexia bacterium]
MIAASPPRGSARASTPPIAPSTRFQRADAAALIVLAGITALVAGNRLAFDSWLTRFDVFTFFLPWYTFLGERLRLFDIPGWNPHLFSGAPFAGDPESGWMYLPAMLLFALLSPLAAFKGMVVLQLAVAALSTYAFARVLGMGPMASLTAAVVYLTGPFLHWNTNCCLIFSQFGTWIPLALLGVELSLRACRWRDRLVPWVVGGFAVSQMLGAWIGEGWLYAVLLPAAFIGFRALLSPPRAGRSPRARIVDGVTTGAVVVGSGLALAAAGILPRLIINAETNLAGGDYAALGDAGVLNPPWALDYLLAQTIGAGFGYHFRAAAFGGAAVVLSILALAMARRRFAVPLFAALTGIALLLALDTTPLHSLFYLIPRYREFHDHDAWRSIALAAIGPAMLSGAAIESLPAWRGRRERLWIVFVPLVLMVALDLALRRREMALGWQPLVAAALTTSLIAVAVAMPARNLVEQTEPSDAGRDSSLALRMTRLPGDVLSRLVPALILVVVFLLPTGLELSGSWLGWPATRNWERHWRPDPREEAALDADVRGSDPGGAGAFLQGRLAASGPFRYAGYGGIAYPGDEARQDSYMGRRFEPAISALLVNGQPIYLGLYDIQGYNPLHLARYDALITALNGKPQDYHTAFLLPAGVDSPLLDLLDVRYVVMDASLPPYRDDVVALRTGAREVFRNRMVIVYERAPELPHVWIVHDLRTVERGGALPLLTSGAIDPYQTALVEGTPPETSRPSRDASESAIITRYEPDEITVATSSA